MTQRHRRPVPTWLIISVGAVVTGAAVIWASGLRDEQGEALLDAETSNVLIALLGVVGTILTLLLKTTAEVKHETRPNSGGSMRDSTNRTERKVSTIEEANDSRHAETKAWLDGLQNDFAGRFATLGRDIGGIREEIRIDRSANNNRFESIENRIKEKP
ncbi:hypothetical protein [Microbacterium aurantiacum]|uniref:hypothetical protein n=1 Tax=Microbacterium aurantiacum TaxID=162393 RepID=UPI0011AF133F|nr:hypothetical protein [Microbacterium aurantiacum]